MSEKKENQFTFEPFLVWNADVASYFKCVYGDRDFEGMSEALTRPPNNVCFRVNTLHTTSEEAISTVKTLLQSQFNQQTSSASFRSGDSSQRDDTCQKDSVEGTLCSEHVDMPGVILVQGSGPHKVNYEEEGMEKMKEVVVSRKCAEAVLRGAHIFVPGVHACSAHVEEGDEVAVSVAIEQRDGNGGWAVGWTRGSILRPDNELGMQDLSKWFIGKGRARLSRAGIFRATHGTAVEMTERVFNLPPCHGIPRRSIFLQNLPSIVTAHVLGPKPGERILDMCAAPGGKTTAIAILMNDEGEVVALDRSHNKVMEIQQLAQEMGLNCIKALKMNSLQAVYVSEGSATPSLETDAQQKIGLNSENEDKCRKDLNVNSSKTDQVQLAMENISLSAEVNQSFAVPKDVYRSRASERKEMRRLRNGQKPVKTKGFLRFSFDRVLLDAPCSALGLRPRLFAGEATTDDLRKHGTYQRRLMDQAVFLVKPGGTLVYSTCTINPGENEAVVRYALDKYPFLSLAPQNPRLGGPGLVGGSSVFDGIGYREWLRSGEEHLVQRFDPRGPLDTIGFFIAKFDVSEQP